MTLWCRAAGLWPQRQLTTVSGSWVTPGSEKGQAFHEPPHDRLVRSEIVSHQDHAQRWSIAGRCSFGAI